VLRDAREVAGEDSRGAAGDAAHAVMFGNPVAVISQRVGQDREIDRVV
jgi:hypothetical protein